MQLLFSHPSLSTTRQAITCRDSTRGKSPSRHCHYSFLLVPDEFAAGELTCRLSLVSGVLARRLFDDACEYEAQIHLGRRGAHGSNLVPFHVSRFSLRSKMRGIRGTGSNSQVTTATFGHAVPIEIGSGFRALAVRRTMNSRVALSVATFTRWLARGDSCRYMRVAQLAFAIAMSGWFLLSCLGTVGG